MLQSKSKENIWIQERLEAAYTGAVLVSCFVVYICNRWKWRGASQYNISGRMHKLVKGKIPNHPTVFSASS
jgi:hypothetical protein